jgi:hypothetical protein
VPVFHEVSFSTVLASVSFNDNVFLEAGKINYVAVNWLLPSELQPHELLGAEMFP